MGVKRLVRHSGDEVHFVVGGRKGALLLIRGEDERECLVIDSAVESDYERIAGIKNVKEARYIGTDNIFQKLKLLPNLKSVFAREILVDQSVEVIFQPGTGRVKVRSAQIVREKDPPKIEEKPRKKKVLIIDDSRTIQKLLGKIVDSSDELEVMAVADRPSKAREIIEKERPDLITLDIHMPEMNGVEFLKSYLQHLKIPTAMVSSVSVEEGPLVMEALSNGALTYIQKPSVDKMAKIAPDIIEQLTEISRRSEVEKDKESGASVNGPASFGELRFSNTEGLIVIGSSTGGTKALQEIFIKLPADIPPIVVVQHIPAVFSQALAERLDSLCPFRVTEAADGDEVLKGNVYIAPGGKQMKIVANSGRLFIKITDDEPVNRFKPSVDYLFDSVAKLRRQKVVAALLTGMGKDGARGLLGLKELGAHTIAQDEASCVVFGMPREAIRLNAASEITHLSEIPLSLRQAFSVGTEKNSA